ncbi:hypothetical protein MNBD_GAMMA16-1100 [hydrothermal vent metagenome]|uniref:HTH araC/xylS-type domain-containing protein n=1 Tax=hydrothermal vent metagenome TaxID=652676 RepID=A0A3B0ZIS4_9ZZZZ
MRHPPIPIMCVAKCHYLENSNISSAEVSFLIGFDDPNSFVRAFHFWIGKTPESVRKKVGLYEIYTK